MSSNKYFRKKSIAHILRHADDNIGEGRQLKKNLNVRDLTAFGIAAIIGAGIFSTIGTAASHGGPAVSLLFVFTAIACGFSALCYAEFASRIPISGSAYTYAYASFGELIAWIIGWDLIMEYAVGNIAVAISWSDYFTSLLNGLGMSIPEYLTTDFLTASRGFKEVTTQLASGTSFADITPALKEAYNAWMHAPMIDGVRFIADIPAFSIVVFITVLVYVGIHETKIAANLMVLLKVIILLIVIAVGSFYVTPENWSPFAPNGLGGVLRGVSGVFFAYIGFDAISTTAEECKNPKRDLPKAMIYALVICTVLYIAISLVLTGMVNYSELAVGDPLAYVFHKLHLTQLSGIIAFSAIIAMASVLLVFQVGQPRIWMSMSRDGLLPPKFSKIHKRFKTPAFSTIITGVLVAIPTLFLNLTEVTDLTSIGTLFAFILVCGGVLLVEKDENDKTRKGFRLPYYNSRKFLPPILIVVIFMVFYFNFDGVINFFTNTNNENPVLSFWDVFKHKIPMYGFIIIAIILVYLSIRKKLSLIPVLGLLTNLYLITELGITNWMRFLIWLVIGLLLYFTYGNKHSKLHKEIKSQ
ncbi:MAG TPA: amino acid permease [Bacteroidales bacterium]|nr:amino acid permease [Bacteroidales bacterium]HPS15693.1 amino acid permease [Bacteroidales bacterium]